ncbi:NAD(P)-dependent oxidoreductase [Tateyamaria sp.]|uniref:NAD(P)-dependent oxidoreductase n=1 Tax=Tateyamaria sp. TaxID=1929288 RepID=UPI00329BE61C
MKNITFIGLGIMGGPMAAHIQKAGHRVTVFNRSPGKPSERLAQEAGCRSAKTIHEAVRDADLVCLCLGDESSVRNVLLGVDGALVAMKEGGTIIDFTTIGRQAALDIAEVVKASGKKFIDAPMTGGDIAAKNATLTIMAGATEQELLAVKDVLLSVAEKVVACGRVGAGQSTKLVNQLMVAVNLASVCEAMVAAKSLGISPSTIVDACGGGAAGSWQLANLGIRAAEGDYAPGFKVSHLVKDLRLLQENLCKSENPDFASEVHERLSLLVRHEPDFAECGTQALYEFYRGEKNNWAEKRASDARWNLISSLPS